MKPLLNTISVVLNCAVLRRILGVFMPFLFLAGVSVSLGADFWEKKDYREWSQKECAKLLEDSPWSKQFTLTSVGVMDDSDRDASDAGQPYIKYQVQLRSALPVRRAIVRQMQLAQKYDSLPPEQKQQFDKSAEAFLAASMDEAVIVYVSFTTNSQPNDLELARYWQSQTTEVLKNYVYLTPGKGDKVYLGRYATSQGGQREFQFIFPRQVDGKPILNSNDKSLKLEFTLPIVGKMGDGRAFLEFKAEKMIFEGNIAY
jgi:hypothetical protein